MGVEDHERDTDRSEIAGFFDQSHGPNRPRMERLGSLPYFDAHRHPMGQKWIVG